MKTEREKVFAAAITKGPFHYKTLMPDGINQAEIKSYVALSNETLGCLLLSHTKTKPVSDKILRENLEFLRIASALLSNPKIDPMVVIKHARALDIEDTLYHLSKAATNPSVTIPRNILQNWNTILNALPKTPQPENFPHISRLTSETYIKKDNRLVSQKTWVTSS